MIRAVIPLLALVSLKAICEDNKFTVDTIKSLPSASALKTSNNQFLSIINTEPLYADDGRLAKGKQDIVFLLDAKAPHPIRVNDKVVNPGSSLNFTIEASANGSLEIPISTTRVGSVGDSNYSITINKIRVLSCPSGYSMSGEMCYKRTSYSPYSLTCPTNYSDNGANCAKSAIWVEDPNATCPSGYNFYHSYQCVDSSGFSATRKECDEAGLRYHGQTGMCHTRYSYILSRKRICSTNTYAAVSGACADLTNTIRKEPYCGSSGQGYYVNNTPMCSSTSKVPAS